MILNGDCIEHMKQLEENSVDAIVTDPPYGLEFMGKNWDKFGISEGRAKRLTGSDSKGSGDKFFDHREGASERGRYSEMTVPEKTSMQMFMQTWATECLRVLKPGGFLLSFGGTRTYHRLVCGIEDAGFEIRDTIMWLYGSGFPKSLNIGKQIDKLNGKKQEEFIALGNYIKEQRLKLGLSTNDMAKYFPSKTGGLTGCHRNWEYGNNVPTKEQWTLLKDKLQLDNSFDYIIEREEAEREKIGERKSNAQDQHKWLGEKYEGHETGIVDITLPATPEAQEWEGWGTALKPACEPIVVARKPLSEKNVALNVLKWGTGGINIDAGRIGYRGQKDFKTSHRENAENYNLEPNTSNFAGDKIGRLSAIKGDINQGRFPANIILEKSYQQIYTLKGSFINLIPLFNEYYGREYMFKLQEEISNLRISDEGQSWKVLQEEMLSSMDEGKEQGKESSNVGEETQQEINRTNEEKQQSEEGQGKSNLQRVLDEQRIQVSQSPRINLRTNATSKTDDKQTGNPRTQDSNGYSSKKTLEDMGGSSSQERSERRQPNREFGNDEQLNPQERTQRDFKRIKAVTKGERGFIVCGCDLPEEWREYFEPTIIEMDYPFSSGKMLDEQSGRLKSGSLKGTEYLEGHKGKERTSGVYMGHTFEPIKSNKGGASRFFYCAKASKSERGEENKHPTVKPIKLMEYLIKLVTKEGATVLDPFLGSGTTAVACVKLNRLWIGIEKEPEYIKIAEARINHFSQQEKLTV